MPTYSVDPPKLKIPNNLEGIDDIGNPDSQKVNQPVIWDLVTQQRLFLQTIPLEIDYNPETTWAVLGTPGRNNPLYQYTGAEDTVKFSISWYANTIGKEDVIKKCKWVEALSKNNGYGEKPHHIKFMFGKLFSNAEWIVFSAPYKLSLFDRAAGMMPCLAIQEITLKRTSINNRVRSNILKIDS